MLNALSLGAGVQSSTLALIASGGELAPKPDFAVFADTQNEPSSVYRWLQWLCGCELVEVPYLGKTVLQAVPGEYQSGVLSFPVIIATKGNLFADATVIKTSRKGPEPGRLYMDSRLPLFIKATTLGGKSGMLQRHCTADYKIKVINRTVKGRVGRKKVMQWIGISTDEAIRMKPSRDNQITNCWPLIDLGMSRADCIAWMQSHGFPKPPRSACRACPYHSDDHWVQLRDTEPEEFELAALEEEALQAAVLKQQAIKGTPFVHRQRIPLRTIVFTPDVKSAYDLFGNECEGMCGV